ncbi:EF-P lysine aminoacylase EpmA [Chiayiivirga flava]|uniref:Lysyl-tRNA synthetase class 2 n=1 Tax=Chiayiivirga flava TaxID=659595 RepID=A0A7W8D5L4_9GAMM|nr:EF-P lysine aminoacylase EpmA [Chiayiivirga flava]MBB5208348.1 lysyl-tRNA synthetase class 2 [Chiayiivirga flava]
MNPQRLAALRLRADVYATIRSFFAARGVLEVESPILSEAGNTDPNIESFATHFSGRSDAVSNERFLRTSPEFPLKRLLAEGVGDCYELGRVFRNGECGRQHNPEFTMLEWYRVGWDHGMLADEVGDLVTAVLARVGRTVRIERVAYRALYRAAFGFDPFTAPIDSLRAPLREHRIDADGLTRDDWLDLLMTHRLQPDFDPDTLLFVFDYPATQCALARIRGSGDDAVAERFEAYLGARELANGYHELTDTREQRQRFELDNARRRARRLREVPLDARLLAALERGLPACAGVALGIERLLMALLRSDAIDDVLAFGFAGA